MSLMPGMCQSHIGCKAEGCVPLVQGFVIIGPPLHYWYLMLSRVSVQGLPGGMPEGHPFHIIIYKPDTTP